MPEHLLEKAPDTDRDVYRIPGDVALEDFDGKIVSVPDGDGQDGYDGDGKVGYEGDGYDGSEGNEGDGY